jgi:GNAT superfamily N-acetyltransferase
VCGVDAPTEAADAFAAAWSQRESISVQAHRMCRVFRLTADRGPFPGMPSWPPPEIPVAAGRLRVAVPADHGMLADWLRVAAIESTERIAAPDEHAADLIGYGGAVFWEVPPRTPGRFLPIGHHRDGAQPGDPGAQPVALATLTRPAAGSVRLSLLYTAQDRRRSGYAAALIQAVSRTLLWEPAAGLPGLLGRGCVREFVMITDMNRPERWGARFGFQLVGERSVLRFGPPTGSLPRAKQTGAQPRLPTGPLPRLPRLRG